MYHPELQDTITYPGGCIRSSEAPQRQWQRAPLVGEHNAEVFGALGLSKEEIVMLKQAGVI
jgi:crotonobetainyl-CoA:carnitine CoA-transferase CaiB-like acyl-CoA transferase